MKLSACIIAKGPSGDLDSAIASVRPLVDEVVVASNGEPWTWLESTHPKVKLFYRREGVNASRPCKNRCGCKPGDILDFSALRNFATRVATGDWALWLDSDDVIETVDKDVFRKLAVGTKPTYFPYQYDGDVYYEVLRLAPKELLEWHYPIHELPVVPGFPETECSKSKDAVWRHQRRDFKDANKRNLRVVQHWEDQFKKDARFQYFAAQAYDAVGDSGGAFQFYERAYLLEKNDEHKYLVAQYASRLGLKAGDYQKSIEWGLRGVGARPNWPSGYFLLGVAYHDLALKSQGERGTKRESLEPWQLEALLASKRFFEVGFSIPQRPVSILPVDPDFGDVRAFEYYSVVLAVLGNVSGAVDACILGLSHGENATMEHNIVKFEQLLKGQLEEDDRVHEMSARQREEHEALVKKIEDFVCRRVLH